MLTDVEEYLAATIHSSDELSTAVLTWRTNPALAQSKWGHISGYVRSTRFAGKHYAFVSVNNSLGCAVTGFSPESPGFRHRRPSLRVRRPNIEVACWLQFRSL
jgi:hypothetical protein